MNVNKIALEKHKQWQGKIEVKARIGVKDKKDLMIAYTPGVAAPCLAIAKNPQKSFELTRRWNTVAVITDGTAVLGLGDIGPEAGMPVMEGKCALMNIFGGLDAVPICLKTKDTDEIVKTIKLISGSFGGINLEDIGAPRCFDVENRLKKELDIPVFHDDQHGTAIVTAAALLNSLKLAKKKIEDVKIVINGPGAAGIAICKFMFKLGAKHITMVGRHGILVSGDKTLSPAKQEIAKLCKTKKGGTLSDALTGADVLIGVSAPNCITMQQIKLMAKKPIVFVCANPIPEIAPQKAKKAGAFVVGTGSSEFPNQINNVLVFPGMFRGAFDAKAKSINDEMMIAAANAIAKSVPKEKLSTEFVLPLAFDKSAHLAVAKAVKLAAQKTKNIRK